jgi:predicted alpha/beta hydrolase family esterase
MKKQVLFIQGAGEGAYEEDRLLVTSLQDALGSAYNVHYPKIHNEGDIKYAGWKAQIDSELATLEDEISLVGHSVGASVLLKYFSEERVEKSIAGLFLIAAPYWGADEFWKWDEARLPQDIAGSREMRNLSITAATTRSYHLHILRCMLKVSRSDQPQIR